MVDFLIIGPKISYNYKNIYTCFIDGFASIGGRNVRWFTNSDRDLHCYWFTNIRKIKRHLELNKLYNKEEYRKYDNFDVINIDRIQDIPIDYDGYMGVPINYIEYYDPDKYELFGKIEQPIIDGKSKFCRILIKKK